MSYTIPIRFKTLRKLADRHKKRLEKFQREAETFFHPHAVMLCQRIKKGIPQFAGCHLAMRHLYLEPSDLDIEIQNPDGEKGTERLGNILDYITVKDGWKVLLPDDTLDALTELDEMSNYIDDNYNMIGGLFVDLKKKKRQPRT